MLKETYKKVQDRVALKEVQNTTRCDPLRCLPAELGESILEFVPFRDLMYVLFFSLPLR